MELRKLIDIFRKQARLFWLVVFACVALVLGWRALERPFVAVDLTLNVTRSGTEKTTDYRYDEFYRLQADERFADTVVRWIGSPSVLEKVERLYVQQSGDIRMQKSFWNIKAERLSSQMIRVTYAATDEAAGKSVAHALITELNEESAMLNKEQQDASWFIVQGDEPFVSDGRLGFVLVLAIALALGVFVGFWTVLIRHYFSSEANSPGND